MGMFIHRTDDSGDNYWDTVELVERNMEDGKTWEEACDELNILAPDIRNIENYNYD